MAELKNLALYKRYLLKETNLLVVQGSIAPVIAGMGVYNSRYTIALPKEDLNHSIHELMAATALAAVSLTERESWGWSLTFKGMEIGYFVGIEPEGMICVKVLDADIKKAAGMIQRQKAGLPMTQSHITPRTRSPLDAVEQYFSEAEQTKTRLAIQETGEGVLVHSLPGGNFDAVKELDANELFQFTHHSIATGPVQELGEVLMFYECRCSAEMISRMIAGLSEFDINDIFRDLQQLEIECPRCGRKHMISRTKARIH